MLGLRSLLPVLPVAASCVIWSSGLRADMPPIAQSQQELQRRMDALGTHFKGGSLARWSNPDDQKALQAMWDPTLLGLAPYTGKDVAQLVNMLKAQAYVLKIYTTAGHAVPGSPKEARVRAKYQDEIVRSSAFLAATSAALLQAMGDFISKVKPSQINPDQRNSIADGRSGIRSLLESLNAELLLPDVTPENKMILLDALAANAETIATYSPEDDRKRYIRAASAVLDKLPAAEKAKLQTFISAMDTKKCEGLCSLKG